MSGRLATHRVDVMDTADEEPTDSIDTAAVLRGLPCQILTQAQGRAVIRRSGVEFEEGLGTSHYLLAIGRHSEQITSGRIVDVTHVKNPVTRHWQPQAEVVRYLVITAITAAGATRHVYAAMRAV